MIALRESLNLHDEATMPRLRAKSLLLTEYLRALVVELCGDKVDIITPTEAHRHGAQLSLVIKSRELSEVHGALRARGIVCDERKPNVIRIAPAPIYNSFEGACPVRPAPAAQALLCAAFVPATPAHRHPQTCASSAWSWRSFSLELALPAGTATLAAGAGA
jgi:hypothetical protein